jgi:hypothetical protein
MDELVFINPMKPFSTLINVITLAQNLSIHMVCIGEKCFGVALLSGVKWR